jgi:hypothetical protein
MHGRDLTSVVIISGVSGLIFITCRSLKIFPPFKMVTLLCLKESGCNYRTTQSNVAGERILNYTRAKISKVGNLNQLPFYCTQEVYQYIRLQVPVGTIKGISKGRTPIKLPVKDKFLWTVIRALIPAVFLCAKASVFFVIYTNLNLRRGYVLQKYTWKKWINL